MCDLSFNYLYSEYSACSCTDLVVMVNTCCSSAAEEKLMETDHICSVQAGAEENVQMQLLNTAHFLKQSI